MGYCLKVFFSTSSNSGVILVNTYLGTLTKPILIYKNGTAVNISGPTDVCAGQTITYHASYTPTATSYGFIPPSGISNMTTNGNSATITYSSSFSGGTLKAFGVFGSCPLGPTTELPIARLTSPPGSVGDITGPSTASPGQTGVQYSVSANESADGFTWDLPVGAVITSGENTNSITVNFPVNFTGGEVSVSAYNCVGNGSISSLEIALAPPQITTQPTSPPMICEKSGTVSISIEGNNITSYQWYERGNPLTNNDLYSGVNAPTLTISNPTGNMDGNRYKVLVTNNGGSFYSSEATLSVGQKPRIVTPPFAIDSL